jgi:hypothetical protein
VTDFVRIAAIVVGLAGLLGLVAWALSPPTADQLYERIAAEAREGDLREVKPDIERFLNSYPSDSRSGEVSDWLLDIQSQYLFNRLRIRQKRETLTEVQQAYVTAMKLAPSQPQAARTKFAELLSQFSDAADTADPITCVQASKHQLQRLEDAETH